MPRARSIPKYLETSILNRWTQGHSAQEITDWIAASNRHRVQPVHTTRSSVERAIARAEAANTRQSSVASVQQLRRQAPALIGLLAKLPAQYVALAESTDQLGADDVKQFPVERARFVEKGRMLLRAELCATRIIRLAGLGGAQGQRLLDANADLTEAAGRALADEVGAEIVRADLDEGLALHLGDVDEEALVTALQQPEPGADPHRLDDAAPTESGASESHPTRPLQPSEVPFLSDAAWLTQEQQAEWACQRRVVNHWLLIACHHGVTPTTPEPATKVLHPRAVPRAQLPDWPITEAQLAELTAQADRANDWLARLDSVVTATLPVFSESPPKEGAS